MGMTSAGKIFALERFNHSDSAPLYIRIKKLIHEAIATEELKQGDSVPSERDVAELLQVSRVTVRKAFLVLVAEGLLVQKRGSGTFVNNLKPRIEQPLSRLTSFSEDMRLRGITTKALWLSRETRLPTPEESLKLSISPSEHIVRLHRLRTANGEPLVIEDAVVPHKFLSDLSSVENSLYDALGAKGFRPVRALQRLHAVSVHGSEARLLELAEGSPALFIERISYLPDGRAVEYTRSHYRGDSYDFVAELTLAQEAGP
jgi:GntR family transcriptional regulator